MPSRTFKTDPVTAEPDVAVMALREEDEFLVVATDGLWDMEHDSQGVVDLARGWLRAGLAPQVRTGPRGSRATAVRCGAGGRGWCSRLGSGAWPRSWWARALRGWPSLQLLPGGPKSWDVMQGSQVLGM